MPACFIDKEHDNPQIQGLTFTLARLKPALRCWSAQPEIDCLRGTSMRSSLIRLLVPASACRVSAAALALTVGLWGLWPGDAGAQFALRSKIEGNADRLDRRGPAERCADSPTLERFGGRFDCETPGKRLPWLA